MGIKSGRKFPRTKECKENVKRVFNKLIFKDLRTAHANEFQNWDGLPKN